MEEIINKVAQSSLEVFDLEDYFPTDNFIIFDISQFLKDGFLLIEKDFREAVKNYDFSFYNNQVVGLQCSTDAILPSWTFLIVATQLVGIAKKVIQSNEKDFIIANYQENISKIDFSMYQNKAVILKGCSKKPVPQEVYTLVLNYLQPFAKSIMYGEACSAVPVFKKK